MNEIENQIIFLLDEDDESLGGKSSTHQILVTKKTPSSISIGWDDFKSPSDDVGYVVQYKPEKAKHAKGKDWMKIEVRFQGINILCSCSSNFHVSILMSESDVYLTFVSNWDRW